MGRAHDTTLQLSVNEIEGTRSVGGRARGANQVDVALGDLEQHELQRLGLRRRQLGAAAGRHGAGRRSAGSSAADRSWRGGGSCRAVQGTGRDRERLRAGSERGVAEQ